MIRTCGDKRHKAKILYSAGAMVTFLGSRWDFAIVASAHSDGSVNTFQVTDEDVYFKETICRLKVFIVACSWLGGHLLVCTADRSCYCISDEGNILTRTSLPGSSIFSPTIAPSPCRTTAFLFHSQIISEVFVENKVMKMEKIAETPSEFQVEGVATSPQSPFLILAGADGQLVLAHAVKRRLLWRNKWMVTFCSRNLTYVSPAKNPSEVKLVLKSLFDSSGFEKVRFQDDSLHVVAITKSSLVFGCILDGKSWEVPWKSRSTSLKFCVRENHTLVMNGKEVTIIDNKAEAVLETIQVIKKDFELISVTGGNTGAVVVFPSGQTELTVFDLKYSRQKALIKLEKKPASVSISDDALFCLVKDQMGRLSIVNVTDNECTFVMENCVFYQWIGMSFFAQAGGDLRMYSNAISPEVVKTFPVPGKVKKIEVNLGKATAVYLLNGTENTLEVSLSGNALSSLRARLSTGDITDFVKSLRNEDIREEDRPLWNEAALASVKRGRIGAAAACFGAAGKRQQAVILQELLQDSSDETSPKVMARLALVQNDVEGAAAILDRAGYRNEAVELLREMNRWDIALEYVDTEDIELMAKLRAEWIEWLTSTGQRKKAARLLEEQGIFSKALDLYLQCGSLGSAVRLVEKGGPFSNDPHAQEKVLDELKNCCRWKEAGKLLENRQKFHEAIEMFRKGKEFQKAIVIAKEHAQNEVVAIEEAWAEHLYSTFDTEEAILHFLEAGKSSRALEIAIEEKMYDQALEISESLNHRDLPKKAAMRLAKYCESVRNFEIGSHILNSAGLGKDAVEYLAKNGLWKKSVDLSASIPDGEMVIESICENLINSNKLEAAEALYTAMGRHDLAALMYQNNNLHDKALKMLSITENQNPEARLKVVNDLISKGRKKEAQDLLSRSGDVIGYIDLCKSIGQWEDALRMSEKLGQEMFFKVALEWCKQVAPEKAVRVLQRSHKINDCIEAALREGEGLVALNLAKHSGLTNLNDIIDKIVDQKVEAGEVEEATKLLCDYGRYRDATQIYIRREMWTMAEEIAAKSGEMNLVKQVQEAELDAAKKSNDYSRLEALALRLGRVHLAVDAYLEAGLHLDADRLRNEYSLTPSIPTVESHPGFAPPLARPLSLAMVASPSSSTAVDRFVESNDWSSAMALAQSMHPEALPDLVRKWLSTLVDLKSLSINEVMPMLSRYGNSSAVEAAEFLCAVGKYQCGQPWSLDYRIWASLRDCFWSAAELWDLSDEMRPVIERYFWAVHLMGVKCACANQPKMEQVAAKALIGLLRYTDLIPPEWLFLEAGKYAQGQDWITVAFILYNAGLDLYDIIEEGLSTEGIDPVEWEEWAELGLPIDQLRLDELRTEESRVVKARDWVLSISLDPRAAKDVNIGVYAGLSPFLGGRTSAKCVLTGCSLKPPVIKFESQLSASKADYVLLQRSEFWGDLELFLRKWVGQSVD